MTLETTQTTPTAPFAAEEGAYQCSQCAWGWILALDHLQTIEKPHGPKDGWLSAARGKISGNQ